MHGEISPKKLEWLYFLEPKSATCTTYSVVIESILLLQKSKLSEVFILTFFLDSLSSLTPSPFFSPRLRCGRQPLRGPQSTRHTMTGLPRTTREPRSPTGTTIPHHWQPRRTPCTTTPHRPAPGRRPSPRGPAPCQGRFGASVSWGFPPTDPQTILSLTPSYPRCARGA